MKNSEHLALFVLGVATLAITFLLLFALGGMDTNQQTAPAPARQAAPPVEQRREAQPQASAGADALDKEVSETFKGASAYLGRGSYDEKEHQRLLERLEFYSGLSSIDAERRKTAQDLLKDMGLLLSMKESAARQIKLSGQINDVVTEARLHLASGKRDMAEGRKLISRIESLYALSGLSEDQNRELRTTLSSLKSAQRQEERAAATAPSSTYMKSAPVTLTPVQVSPTPIQTTPPPPPAVPTRPVTVAPAVPATPPAAAVEARPEPAPTTVAPAAATQSAQPSPQVQNDYFRVMTYYSSYFVKRKYNETYHAQLTSDLKQVLTRADELTEKQKRDLRDAIDNMEEIDKKFRR